MYDFSDPLRYTQEDKNKAKFMYERLIVMISKFEETLPYDKQAGITAASFNGTAVTINNISYWGPDIIIFYGSLPDGAPVKLIQHINQLNIALIAVPRKDDTSQPRRSIGFLQD